MHRERCFLTEMANLIGRYRREVVYQKIAGQIITPKEEIPWGVCCLSTAQPFGEKSYADLGD